MYVVLIIPVVVTTLLRFHPCSSGINDSRFLDIEKTNIYFAWVEEEARVALRLELRLEQLLRIFRALQTTHVLHISMNAQLTYEPIVK